MSTLGNVIGGVVKGAADPNYPAQMREQNFQHQENALRLWQMQHQDLANAIDRNAGKYAGPEGERLRDLQIEVGALKPGSDLAPYYSKYSQHTANAQKALEQKAAAEAGTIKPVAPVASPNVQNSSPFASMIGQGVQGAFPGPQMPAQMPQASAAQAPTSPISPAAQIPPVGGGPQANAGFQPSANDVGGAVGAPGPAGASAPFPPVAASGGDAAVSASTIAPVAGPMNLQPSFDAFNKTGYIDPVSELALPGQVGLATAQQKLQMIEPYIREMPAQMQGIVRAEILAGGTGMNSVMAAAFRAPQKSFVDAGSMTAEEKIAAGIPPDAAGKYTIFRDFSHNVVGADPGWAGSATTTNEQGIQGKQSVNDALKNGGALTAVGGGASVAPGTIAPVNTGVNGSGHNVYETRGNILRDIQSGNGIGKGVNPSILPHVSNEVRTVQTVDDQGRPVTQIVPVQVSGSKVLPGISGARPSAPAASGPQSFIRPLSAATQRMREAAPSVIQLANKVQDEISSQEKSLGPAASRWSEFWAGKVGAPNPEFTSLRTNTALLTTLLMRMHTGSQGSEYMQKHFQDLIDSGKQSPENMHAAIGEIISYANDKLAEGPKDVKSGDIPPIKGQDLINMRAPDGSVRPVPAAQVEHYKSRGAVVVQ